jgi:hypothetical protein
MNANNSGGTIENDVGHAPPKKGDRFRCASCGMEIQVTTQCGCKEEDHVHFHCCNKEMTKA